MKTVKIGPLVIGEGRPKICVPLTGREEQELQRQARKASELPCDLVEWRADYLRPEAFGDLKKMESLAETLTGDCKKPLLLTLRTLAEGGMADMDRRDYYSLIREYMMLPHIDLIDIEAFDEQQGFHGEKMEFLVGLAHSNEKKVILSSHDFDGTPDLDVMVKQLFIMQELGADIPKIAVMAHQEQDALDLLEAARIMKESYAKGPFIALAMGEHGRESRICGGHFGSAITFASGGAEVGMEASAPGQMDASTLHRYLQEYYA